MSSSVPTEPLKQKQDPEAGTDVYDYFESQPEEKSYFVEFLDQLFIMLKRNAILQLRYTSATIAQTIIAPFIFLFCLFVLQKSDHAIQLKSNPNPVAFDVTGIKNCQGEFLSDPCINVLFTPNESPYTDILSVFNQKNSKRTGEAPLAFEAALADYKQKPTSKLGFVPVSDSEFIYNYTLYNPNVTEWAVSFSRTTDPVNIQYQVWYNVTQTINGTDIFGAKLVSFMRGLDEAIMSVLNNATTEESQADYNYLIKDWPLIPASTVNDKVIQNLGPVFFFCTIMVIFVNVLNQIVGEKEMKLRYSLEVMGLKPSVFWISHYMSFTFLVAINALFTVIFGIIFNFTTFLQTSFFVLFLVFFLFGEAMVMLAFFLTTLVRTSRAAVLNGISVFIVGLLFQSFVFSGSLVGYIWWDVNTTPAFRNFFVLLPFFNFGKAFLDISTLTLGRYDPLTQTFVAGPGFSISSLYEPIPDDLKPFYPSGEIPDIPAAIQSVYLLLMNIVLYAFLTWYFDNVIPNEFGSRLAPWFPFTPKYWNISLGGTSRNQEINQSKWLENMLKLERKGKVDAAASDEDAQVTKERQSVKTDGIKSF